MRQNGRTGSSSQLHQNSRLSLIVTLHVPYYLFNPKQLKQFGFKISNTTTWPYKTHKFKLGHNPWQGLGLPKPTESTVREVHKRLSEYHAQFSFDTFVNVSVSEAIITIDNVIQVILAQNTGNENAIDTHSRLCNTFTYTLNGKKHAGTVPNWHEVRKLPIGELEKALKPTGYHQRRARSIKAVLDAVYAENVKRKGGGSHVSGDGSNLSDDMLSMRYITDSPDSSTESILSRLLSLPGIGPKSAMCIIAFQLKRPLFVVDTHVLRYTKWLGWIPRTCDDINAAAMYLHDVVPDDIKYDLHNQIWTHCAKADTGISGRSVGGLCPFCASMPPSRQKLRDAEARCPVADFLIPLSERWPKRAWKEVEGVEKKEDDVVTSKYFSVVQTSKKKSKPLKLLRTMPFQDLTPEEAEAHGYLLWQFRPLDNSFGEEWGTFEAFPRFKWEKPDVMDPEVAVSVEYARDVLAGNKDHPWSKKNKKL